MSDAEHLAKVCATFNAAPYYVRLGIVAGSDGVGRSRVRLPFSDGLTQLYGGIHGGALMSLADSALSVAIATTLGDDEAISTVAVSMFFLEPAGPNEIIAEGTLTRRGKRMAFAACTLSAGGRVIARAEGTCAIGSIDKIRARQIGRT